MHPSAPPPAIVASADEFAAQAPTMLLYSATGVAAAAPAAVPHPPLKRRTSSGGSASKRARDSESSSHAAFSASSSHVISAPMLADGGAAHAASRRCAPSFANMPNAVTHTQTHAHGAHAATAISSPHAPSAASAAHAHAAPAPLRFPKRHLKSLAHDLSSFTSALSKQSIGVVQELLPARIVAITRMEKEFAREWKAETDAIAAAAAAAAASAVNSNGGATAASASTSPAIVSAAATTAAASSSPASQSHLLSLSTAVIPSLPSTLEFVHPIPSLTEHSPFVRGSLPQPGSQCTQHGWTFLQPPRAVPCDAFTTRWVRSLSRELADFQSLLGVLRVSLTLNQPSAADTNNVSLEVSEEMFSEIRYKEEWASGLRARLNGSFQIRAKCLSKVVKYPGVADYAAAVAELDAGLRCTLLSGLQSLRNSLIVIRDKYGRNMERLLLDPAGDQAFQSMI